MNWWKWAWVLKCSEYVQTDEKRYPYEMLYGSCETYETQCAADGFCYLSVNNLYPNDMFVASCWDCQTHTVAVVLAKATQLHKMRQQFLSTVMFNFGPHLSYDGSQLDSPLCKTTGLEKYGLSFASLNYISSCGRYETQENSLHNCTTKISNMHCTACGR